MLAALDLLIAVIGAAVIGTLIMVTAAGPSGLRHGQHHPRRRIHRYRRIRQLRQLDARQFQWLGGQLRIRQLRQLDARQFQWLGGQLRIRQLRLPSCPPAPPPRGLAEQHHSDYSRTDADERRAYGRKPQWVQAA